jgi:hypothetical protein
LSAFVAIACLPESIITPKSANPTRYRLISAEFGETAYITRAQEAGSNPGCVAKEKLRETDAGGEFYAGLCVLGIAAVIPAPAGAQTSEVKEKLPMYSYSPGRSEAKLRDYAVLSHHRNGDPQHLCNIGAIPR